MESKPSSASTPSARVLPLDKLPGWISKSLDVPPLRTGIVVTSSGKSTTYPSGKHIILSPIDRLRGKGVGLQIGYVSTEPVTARLTASYLLSGDEILVDAAITYDARITDLQRYFCELVIPMGEIPAGQINFSNEEAASSIRQLVRRYTADDLIHGLPTHLLAAEIQRALSATLQNLGMEVDRILLITFWRSDDKVKATEKIMELEQDLQNIELQKKMAEVESQIQLDDFIHQLDPEFSQSAGVRPVMHERTVSGNDTANSAENLKKWLVDQTTHSSGSHWRLSNLFSNDNKNSLLPSRRPPQNWWVGRTIWILFLVCSGAGITLWTTNRFSGEPRKDLLYGFLTGLWLFLLPFILGEIKKLVEKWEKVNEAVWNLHSATHLQELIGDDKNRADRLVRKQCLSEMERSRSILEDMVSRLYNAGSTDSAIRLRELRHKFESTQERLKQPDFGNPAYLSDNHLSSAAWGRTLDYDENLLSFAGAITEQVFTAQQNLSSSKEIPTLNSIEQHLDEFLYRFSGRSQVLKNL